MDAVDERHRFASGSFVAKRAALALRPGFELHLASGIFLGIGVCLGVGVRLFLFCFV